MKIYILCGNAAFNRGDRGNLLTQLRLLRNEFPQAEIVFDSYRPEVDKKWYKATIIKRGLFLTWQQWGYLRKADIVIWGGGALIADNSCRTIIPYWLVVITLIKKVLRKPVMAWAQGIVIETKIGAILGRLTLNQVDLITVRDEDSFNTLQRIKAIKPPHFLTADPAILLETSSVEVGKKLLRKVGVPLNDGRMLISLSATFWPFYHDKKDIIPFLFARKIGFNKRRSESKLDQHNTDLAKLIDALIEKNRANVVILPRYPDLPWDDMKHIQEMRNRCLYKEKVFIYNNDEYPPQDYLAMWKAFDLVVSVALHDSLFALAVQRPCIQLYYEPKGKSLALELRAVNKTMADWEIIRTNQGIQCVADQMVKKALSESYNLEIQKIVSGLKQRASSNIEYLKTLVSDNSDGRNNDGILP